MHGWACHGKHDEMCAVVYHSWSCAKQNLVAGDGPDAGRLLTFLPVVGGDQYRAVEFEKHFQNWQFLTISTT